MHATFLLESLAVGGGGGASRINGDQSIKASFHFL